MTDEQVTQLRSLEGRHISLALNPVPPDAAGPAVTAVRWRNDDAPKSEASFQRPLAQLISMTDCALPPAVPHNGDDGAGPPRWARGG